MASKEKDKLRSSLKTQRSQMSYEESVRASLSIAEKLKKTIDWSTTPYLHCYLPIKNQREIDTWGFIDWLFEEQPKTQVYTSIYRPNQQLKHVVINSDTTYHTDDWQVPNPTNYQDIETPKFSVIIVPTLAYDRQKNRLGYGFGVYDRFLATQPQARKIGVAYDQGLVTNGLPVDEYDVRLDAIITPSSVLD